MRYPRLGCLAAIGVFAFASAALGQEAAEKITYDDHVRPIFRQHCFSCHNQNQAKSDLALDSFTALTQGGASGAVIEAGDPNASRLWKLVAHEDQPAMPPEQDKLPEEKLALVKRWLEGGALENSGSTAKVKPKPTVDLAASAGFKRPEGAPPMPGKLPRQPVVHTGRTGALTALAASPWAPLAAVAGQKQVVLYNTDSGEYLGVLPFPEGTPHVIKFSRSGTVLLVGGGRAGQGGKVVVFDVKTGARVFEVGDELDVVLAADMNEDHTKIALGGPQRVVRIYSALDGSLLQEIRKHTDWIYSLEFSPDGVLLASADRTGGLFVWEAETAREYQNLKAHTAAVTDVSWRDDGNVLASCSEDTTVKLWEMENGSNFRNWGAHGGGCASLEFTHDGRLVSVGRDRQAKIWDQNGAQQRAFDALPDVGLDVVFTHDGARVIAGDWTGEVRMWDAADGKQVAVLSPNPPTLETALATATQRLAEAETAATQAAAEHVAAQTAATEKASAVAAADMQLATAQTAATQAAAAQLQAEQLLIVRAAAAKAANDQLAAATEEPKKAAATAVAQQVEAERAAAEKDSVDQTAAAKAAADAIVAAQAQVDKSNQEKAAADLAVAEKAAAAQAAAERAAAAKAAAERAAADLKEA